MTEAVKEAEATRETGKKSDFMTTLRWTFELTTWEMFKKINIRADSCISEDTPMDWEEIPLTDIQKAVIRAAIVEQWQRRACRLWEKISRMDGQEIPVYFRKELLDDSARYVVSAVLKYCNEAIPKWFEPAILLDSTGQMTLQK